jgi:hypothetical protein
MREVPQTYVLNLGAGVQSTTLYLMAIAGQLRVDSAIFADPGDEPKAVYKHLAWLQSLNGPPIMVRSKGSRIGDDLMRGENSTGQRFASIPAFTLSESPEDDDGVGQTRRQCSAEYKIAVIEQAIRREVYGLRPRQRMPKDSGLTQYIGFSIDEAARAQRMIAPRLVKGKMNKAGKWIEAHWVKPRHLGKVRFPLIERFMTRTNCIEWLGEFGKVPHEIPKSACVFCPFHDDLEWLKIKAVPEDWGRAVQVDTAMRVKGNIVNRNRDAQLFLHRSCQPLTEIVFDPKAKEDGQVEMPFWRECLGVCGV